jgi:methanogenic corrinoid protein MtbC1
MSIKNLSIFLLVVMISLFCLPRLSLAADFSDENRSEAEKLLDENIETQREIEESIKKLERRNRIITFIFGPNRSELEKLEKLIDDNEENLQRLEEIKDQVVEGLERENVERQIERMKEHRDNVRGYIDKFREAFSLLGQIIDLFRKN